MYSLSLFLSDTFKILLLYRLEPNNARTVDAISRLENALVAKLENHLELEVDDVPDSDEEVKEKVANFTQHLVQFSLFLSANYRRRRY